MSVLLLESLIGPDLGLTKSFCDCLIESAVVCLSDQQHNTPVLIIVDYGTQVKSFTLHWETPVTNLILNTYRDERRTTDFGAMCIGLLLVKQLTAYTTFTTTRTGDGVDFWLMEGDDLDFSARLEVSGIRNETKSNTTASRLEQKKKQTRQSDETELPAYIVIVEFSKPKAIFFQK